MDADLPENGSFTDEQLVVLDMAFQRISERFLVVKEDTCYLTTHSAKDVNMSERLFALMEKMTYYTNVKYQMYVLCKENYPGVTIENPFDPSAVIARTKATTETVVGPYISVTIITLSDEEVTTILNALRAATGVKNAFAASIIGKFGGGVVTNLIISAFAFLCDSCFSNMQDEYAKSGSRSGMTLKELVTYSPTTGSNAVIYQGAINK